MNRIITGSNNIYIYFKAVDLCAVNSMLDVGMFLKRCGCISRQAMDQQIPVSVDLTGIDLMPDYPLLVYNQIYNRIAAREEIEREPDRFYDLSVMLCLPPLVSKVEEIHLWMMAVRQSRAILADYESSSYFLKQGLFTDAHVISVDGENYCLINTHMTDVNQEK